jgi:transcriptional regulator with XRE-family HTH domain
MDHENLLGTFLKDRRARLDPVALGFGLTRRRTPGLRREEVALRANVSTTWYTWLEQGREGMPSADVLERLVKALDLSHAEREHMFLIAQSRPPKIKPELAADVPPRLQTVLDSLEFSPAIIKTSMWDIVAWNRAASIVLTDYGALVPADRNVMRLLFCNPKIRARSPYWESQAKLVVAAFRLQSARAGCNKAMQQLVDELSEASPEFAELWQQNDVGDYAEGTKHINHPLIGPLALEYSSFAVEGQSDLELLVYTPATPADKHSLKALIGSADN